VSVLLILVFFFLKSDATFEGTNSQHSNNVTIGYSPITISEVLWSKNWGNVVSNSCKLPENYYSQSTETAHPASYFVDQLRGKNCTGIIWIRQNSFMQNNDLERFIEAITQIPLANPFTLISTDGDNTIPSNLKNKNSLLNNPLLQNWFTQNIESNTKYPKLKPVPIGFDLHTQFDDTMGVGQKALDVMLDIRKNVVPQRRLSVLISLRLTGPDRGNAIAAIQSCSNLTVEIVTPSCSGLSCQSKISSSDRYKRKELFEHFNSIAFGLSPQGNGKDCHRTWEMFFFGMVPIVRTSELDPLYLSHDLPVIILKEWKDFCHIDFKSEYERLKKKLPIPIEKFMLKNWN